MSFGYRGKFNVEKPDAVKQDLTEDSAPEGSSTEEPPAHFIVTDEVLTAEDAEAIKRAYADAEGSGDE